MFFPQNIVTVKDVTRRSKSQPLEDLRFKTEDLPPIIFQLWKTKWLPHIYAWYGTEPNPWKVDPASLISFLESMILKYATPDCELPDDITKVMETPLYQVVCMTFTARLANK